MSYDTDPLTPEQLARMMHASICSDVRRAQINIEHALVTARQNGWPEIEAALRRSAEEIARLYATVDGDGP